MNGISDQYRTITDGAGWLDRRNRGRVRVDGRDGVKFLQALLSNDVARLKENEGIFATYLTPQGRMIADLTIYHRGSWLLADVAPGLAARLTARLDQVIFAEQVTVTDASAAIVELSVVGGRAAAVVAQALSLDEARLGALAENEQLTAPDARMWVARAGDARLPMFSIFADADGAADASGTQTAAAFDVIVSRLEDAGARPLSGDLADALRVDAGRPAFGIDMTEETIPLEAGLLDRAISTTKGCYVGQEVVIRILHRGGGRVARRLVTMAIDPATASGIAAGAVLSREGRDIGRMTTVASSLTTDGVVALGYVQRELAEVGQRLALRDRPDVTAVVTGFAG
ncbi:MAG: glycine cleavage T C-terminal barrel domain-containing protein [Acidobacteriota bacterium]